MLVVQIAQARLGGGAMVQLPCKGHPAHPATADYGSGTDAGV